jgi:hypothetical protein
MTCHEQTFDKFSIPFTNVFHRIKKISRYINYTNPVPEMK